ncbi:MAG: hypothetical protein L3J65_03615 [Robiginitomaculum sp.]|nr:hypothetical protein [Robiginitomaculum sp.]
MVNNVKKQSLESLRKQLEEAEVRAQLAESRMRISSANFQAKRARMLSEAMTNKNIMDFIRM